MVPAFTPQNIRALGPLIVVGCIYQALGLVLALIIREFFWVPHRFRSGLIFAGIWSNWGDWKAIAIILSVAATAPFKAGDGDLGVAYISIFILLFNVTLFPLGGHLLIANDFKGSDKTPEQVKEELKRRQNSWFSWCAKLLRLIFLQKRTSLVGRQTDVEGSHKGENETESRLSHDKIAKEEQGSVHCSAEEEVTTRIVDRPQHVRHTISCGALSNTGDQASVLTGDDTPVDYIPSPGYITATTPDEVSTTPTAAIVATKDKEFNEQLSLKESQTTTTATTNDASSPPSTLTSRFLGSLRALVSPITIAMFVAFPIALIQPLKSLFLELEESSSSSPRIPNAPDGKPPLYFILDTTSFLGGASIPLGLICLGAAFASLKIPSRGGSGAGNENTRNQSLPVGAIASMAVAKLVVSPVLGILIVNGFVKIGFIDEDDKVLRFVAMFFSGMPTSTSQVLLTQVYSGTGEAEHLSAFLIPQYALMFVSTTALTAYSLHTIF
ncbi:Protein M3 [Serendipita sp. 399]|nr:Protein M3 [Serendipita sp. 399]